MIIREWSRSGVVAAVIACGGAGLAGAQIPDAFKNLQVLPQGISKAELVETMKDFTQGLDVRCEHCHVGEAGAPLASFDFAADSKPAKLTARTMLQLTGEINRLLAAKLDRGTARGIEVTCTTCHHGLQVPQTLEQVLAAVLEQEGETAAVAKYHALRGEYYGSAAYDFSPESLARLAQELTAQQRFEPALRFLQLNLELHPDSVWTLFQLAELELQRGDREAARAHYQKVIELQPDESSSAFVKQRLQQLEAPADEDSAPPR
ncbi:MAG TPA: c-type cytochrome [Acidobacteriota bacterium]